MIKQLRIKLEKIIQEQSQELHKLSLKVKEENFAQELRELKEEIQSENRFNFSDLEVIEFDLVNLTAKWKGPNFGENYVY